MSKDGGWQLIATAPTGDRDLIIAWNGVTVLPAFRWENGWSDIWYDWMNPQPTHWMPLPSPRDIDHAL